jgi:thiol-disulfide isomerase/thioredoxin
MLVVVVVVVMAGIRFWQQRDIVSGPAPVLQGVTLAGRPYKLPAHPDRPVLVHFWATWCPICRAEQGSIAAMAQDNQNVITIAMQSGKPEEVASYMRAQGITFPVLNDADGSTSAAWGVHAVPASFIISPDGQIKFVEVGYTTGIGLRLRLWLAGL